MTGWEVNVDTFWPAAYRPYIDRIVAGVVDDVGIDRVRVEVVAGAENPVDYFTQFAQGQISETEWANRRYDVINDNSNPNSVNAAGFNFTQLNWNMDNSVLPIRNRLAQSGRSLFINLCYVAMDESQASEHTVAAEYAEFITAAAQHMRTRYGISPDAIEVILEPDNDSINLWSGRLMGEAMAAAGPRLQAAGFTPRFIAPSTLDLGRALTYLDGIASVSGALQYLDEVSYHRYGGATTSNLTALVNRARQLNKKTSMLEWWFGNATYEVLHQDLTLGNVSSWQGRAFPDLYVIDNGNIRLVDDYRYNLQYFRYIRRGATRIGATSDNATFAPVAFINPDGSRTVVVKAEGAGTVRINGLPSGNYRVSWATSAGSNQLASPIAVQSGNPLSTNMPGRGVITITSLAN